VPDVTELSPADHRFLGYGARRNAVANMIRSELLGVEFVVGQHRAQGSPIARERRIQLGSSVTQGWGAGSRPEIGGGRRRGITRRDP